MVPVMCASTFVAMSEARPYLPPSQIGTNFVIPLRKMDRAVIPGGAVRTVVARSQLRRAGR